MTEKMKNRTIIGIILIPILCIVISNIISVGKKKANNDFEKALADFATPSDSIRDSDFVVDSTNSYTTQLGAVDNDNNRNLPTQQEIASVNASLPKLISDGTMLTKVEYNEKSKVETFYYDFTRDVDKALITSENISQLKENMINALKGTDSEERLKAGVTFLYVYRSLDNIKLYDIRIKASDLE